MRTKTLEAAFWEKVLLGPNCWIWTGGCAKGYGRLRLRPRSAGVGEAHRISWELHVGTIPPGLQVCHKCDNTLCVRPEHLFLGTHSDNQVDCRIKGRHPRSKLSPALVRQIRQERPHKSYRQLSQDYGISMRSVYCVLSRRTWSHVR